mmetsp:Transcript_1779/g.2097  ORF Transcript_1779/g.2097 Transcript_1779/m.2097 type:complete len:165 (-) Transcript_1779:285-779(-)|eukprot:CAMPEP_0184009922 /NCGR_PEP_ID=MMETSP0954-20121128/2900_1 /TAXON_ID=627963 /ORGANISM="Aplanochytrium sp, Strain PBS07" /LENGTH=164 /DNA_ID=CAMNT_0026289401 /DNA_START=54 /DNA_END=548 /DNA_ORIENTATION=-
MSNFTFGKKLGEEFIESLQDKYKIEDERAESTTTSTDVEINEGEVGDETLQEALESEQTEGASASIKLSDEKVVQTFLENKRGIGYSVREILKQNHIKFQTNIEFGKLFAKCNKLVKKGRISKTKKGSRVFFYVPGDSQLVFAYCPRKSRTKKPDSATHKRVKS